jgi:glycolate oxidase FAD binding subunit
MDKAGCEAQVLDFVRDACADRRAFEIVAGGTRRAAGRPTNLPLFDVSGLTGVIKYEPEELILTVRPGTPLAEINTVLADKNQCLGFDPVDWGFLGQAGTATIGGALSADASGSGRLRHGAARDSLLGFRAVNGLGEAFNAGGKVVKNVTGFDLPKLVCGAFGTLCVLTELTFRVYPKPRCSSTVALTNVTPQDGFAALRKIWHSALEPSGLAYLPGGSSLLADIGKGAALIRFEAAEKPLAEKCAAAGLLVGQTMAVEDGDALFAVLGSGAVFADSDLDVWKVFLPPSEAARVALAAAAPLWLGDWAGGVLWLGVPGEDGSRLRALAADAGGHAQLLRAPAERRTALGMFAPKPAALEAISARVRAAFDPLSLFNPGRL